MTLQPLQRAWAVSYTHLINEMGDLSGKEASILVYQANNTDPNKYQLQYVGKTEVKKVLDESETVSYTHLQQYRPEQISASVCRKDRSEEGAGRV